MIGHQEVEVSAPGDELIELLRHTLLDVGHIELEQRRRLSRLMFELRSDARAAGHAAERVERELGPALSWSVVLDEIVHERWERLEARGAQLARQTAARSSIVAAARDAASERWAAIFRRGAPAGHDNGSKGVEREQPHVPEPKPPAHTATRSHPHGSNGTAPASTMEEAPPPLESPEPSDAVTRKQIRGSGLLLAGRGLATGLKFLAELIVIRYLTTQDYGAWTYALAAVTFLRGMSALGLARAIARYLPLHMERGEYRKFYGVLVFVFGGLVLAGALVVAAFYAFPGSVGALAGVAAEQPLALLFIVIFLVPVENIDNALMGVSATFGDSRTIFVRRFLLHPGLRIVIAGGLVLMQADVVLLAYGYLLSGVLGIAYYAAAVVRQMHRRGLLKSRYLHGLPLPVRTVLSYTTPVMAADWCAIYMLTAGPLLLGYFSDMTAVALYQVVVPAAALNTIVFQSFGMLFEPAASRLHARDDPHGMNHLYWRSAVWVAVLTFPLFALSFTAAVPITVLLFGERYVAAAPILSLLAAGQFVDAMMGFNAATLRVTGSVRWLVVVNAFGAAIVVGLSILLIPTMGALGAGIGTAAGYFLYTVFKQIALQMASGVHAFDSTYRGPYLTIAAVGLGLVAVRILWPENLWVVVPAVVVGSLAVYASARVSLSVSATFPELGRSRFLRAILG